MKSLKGILFALVLLMLCGCAAGPRAVEPVPFYLLLTAASDINPDSRGRATPVVIRIYELRSSSAFESADFFSLFEKEREVLGADLIKRDEMTLRPTETRQLSRRAHPEARMIGIVAAYRNLERSTWRAVAPLPPPAEVSTVPVVGPYVTMSPREQQLLVQLKYQSIFTSQEKAPLFHW